MDKGAPYKSIHNVVEASLLECPCDFSLCGLCIYHDFCNAMVKAFGEARKLSETDAKIKSIIDEAYKKRYEALKSRNLQA